MPPIHTLRIVGSGGANRAMEAELKRLAPRAIAKRPPKAVRVDTQTLLYEYSPELAEFAVDYLRTPSRVIRDLFSAKSPRLEPLFDEVRSWIAGASHDWLEGVRTISVRVVEPFDFPSSGLQLRGTIKNAIIEGSGKKLELDAEHPDLEITVRGRERPLILGIDLAGGSMHARGYRVEQGEAPLKETLAAQMLILSRWDSRTEALVDPLAGAGTIPIEAALMALGAPHARAAKKPDLFGDARPTIIANEIHTPLADALRRNAERAGVGKHVRVQHGDIRDLRVDAEQGLLIANPPYGVRLTGGRGGERELFDVYEDLAALQQELGFRAAYIVANENFEEVYGAKPVMKKPMWNGALRAWFLVYDA